MSDRITFSAKSGASTSGELALPAGAGKAPAVVLVQEYWGLNGHIRSLLGRLAAEGFVALAPDLYHGTVATDAAHAAKLMKELDGKAAVDEIAGAVALLHAHPRSNGKVGIVGFCLGGALAFRAAGNVPGLAAAVPFYGLPGAGTVDFAQVKVPIQAHFSARDAWATPDGARAIQKTLEEHGQAMELHLYDADHAFLNDTRPEVFAPGPAKLAWERAVAFLHAHLG